MHVQSILKFSSYVGFFPAQLSVKLFHCVCKHISMYSFDKLHNPEFSIPLTVVALQGAICLTFNGLHHLKITERFGRKLGKKKQKTDGNPSPVFFKLCPTDKVKTSWGCYIILKAMF